MNCFEKMHLPQSATLEEVKQQWRILAAHHHPDKGGDAKTFDDYHRAYRTALAVIGKRNCTECLGVKKIPSGSGFELSYIDCPHCVGGGLTTEY